eukprot:Selendium_serpulae@DN6260_c0_g1_i7.p1
MTHDCVTTTNVRAHGARQPTASVSQWLSGRSANPTATPTPISQSIDQQSINRSIHQSIDPSIDESVISQAGSDHPPAAASGCSITGDSRLAAAPPSASGPDMPITNGISARLVIPTQSGHAENPAECPMY